MSPNETRRSAFAASAAFITSPSASMLEWTSEMIAMRTGGRPRVSAALDDTPNRLENPGIHLVEAQPHSRRPGALGVAGPDHGGPRADLLPGVLPGKPQQRVRALLERGAGPEEHPPFGQVGDPGVEGHLLALTPAPQ